MLKMIGVGKNVEDAVLNAIIELKVRREDVDVTILEKGGLFKKAKVEVSLKPEIEEKLKNREDNIKKLETELLEQKQQKEDEIKEDVVNVETTEEKMDNSSVEEENDNLGVKDSVVQFIRQYCEKQGINPDIEVSETKDDLNIQINGNGVKDLIGFRGEGLNSLQYICNIYASKIDENCQRILINIGSYREEREQELIKLARRLATKVAKTKQRIKLDAMPAYERKIIHKALQNDDFVQTFSVGFEPKRSLIIDVKKT